MLLATEKAMHVVLEEARADVLKLRADFERDAGAAPRTFRLSASDPYLEPYGSAGRTQRRRLVEQAHATNATRLDLLLAHYEDAMWSVASEAGRRELGSTLGTRSGYVELDEKVDAALIQLHRDASVETLEQQATLRVHDDVVLERSVREDLEGLGILSLYKSAPTTGLFAPDQEGQAVAIVFARDPELDHGVSFTVVQAVRRIIERGGVVLTSTPWRLDGAADGAVPASLEVDARRYLVTDPCIPAVDTASPSFAGLHDRILVSEHRTALRRDDTGALVATLGWQVRWNVDFRGHMRELLDRADLALEDDPVLPALLEAAAR
jgi:hypothetical protein